VPPVAINDAPNAFAIEGGWTTVLVAVVELMLMPPAAVMLAVFETEKTVAGVVLTVAVN
jgi:hypothetical protein